MLTRTRTWARRAKRVAGSRWWLVVIAAVLVVDFLAIPHTPLRYGTVKWELFGASWGKASLQPGWRLSGRPHPSDDGLGWIWSWEPGYEGAESSRWDGTLVYFMYPRRAGMYHLTRETHAVRVFAESLTPAEVSALHAVLIDELRNEPEVQTYWTPECIETLHRGGTWTRELPSGHWLDLIAASLAVAWAALLSLHSFYWFLRGRHRVWRRWFGAKWRRGFASLLAPSRKHATHS